MNNAERHSIIPAVWMIIKNDKDEIFLLRRANTGWRDGWYTVPAGHIEKNESPTQAAIRELQEEAGIMVTKEDLSEPLVHFYPADDGMHERVSLFFVVTTNQAPMNAEPHKADQSIWAPMDQLSENIVPLLRRGIIDIANGVRYSERYYDANYFKELLQ